MRAGRLKQLAGTEKAFRGPFWLLSRSWRKKFALNFSPKRLNAGVKAIVVTVLVMGFLGTAVVGFFGWKHFTRQEVRGVQLEMQKEVPAELQAEMIAAYYKILDDPEILSPLIEKHGLVDYYKVGSTEAAVEKLQEDSFVKFKSAKAIQILFEGPRNKRQIRDRVAEELGTEFIKKLQEQVGQ